MFSQIGIITESNTFGEEGLKVSIIDKLDIRDEPRGTRFLMQ